MSNYPDNFNTVAFDEKYGASSDDFEYAEPDEINKVMPIMAGEIADHIVALGDAKYGKGFFDRNELFISLCEALPEAAYDYIRAAKQERNKP